MKNLLVLFVPDLLFFPRVQVLYLEHERPLIRRLVVLYFILLLQDIHIQVGVVLLEDGLRYLVLGRRHVLLFGLVVGFFK